MNILKILILISFMFYLPAYGAKIKHKKLIYTINKEGVSFEALFREKLQISSSLLDEQGYLNKLKKFNEIDDIRAPLPKGKNITIILPEEINQETQKDFSLKSSVFFMISFGTLKQGDNVNNATMGMNSPRTIGISFSKNLENEKRNLYSLMPMMLVFIFLN